MPGRHTIVLFQKTKDPKTRTFTDHESVNAAMDGVCAMFESFLKERNPHVANITYDVSDLYAYIDHLGDLSCLVFEQSIMAYQPFNRQWIKEQVLRRLQEIASGGR